MNEEVYSDERNPAEGNNELPPASLEQNEVGDMLPGRLPPTAKQLVGNDMLWLIAKTCHDVNRVYCASLGDHSHAVWELASSELRESCYNGVLFHLENPNATDADSHNAWMNKRIADGWMFGNVKSEQEKTHPNLIPWHQLHAQERVKDTMFRAICRGMLGSA